MYDFIFQIIIFSSFGLIIYLFARGAARTPDSILEAAPVKPAYFDRLIQKIPFKKIDDFINSSIGKLLRKMKVVVMKIDNLLNRYIGKFKKNGNSSAGSIQDGGPPKIQP